MAQSVCEKIALDIQDALDGLRMEAGAEGDADIQRPDATGNILNDRSAVASIETSVETNDAPMMHDGYLQTFLILMKVAAPDDDDSLDQQYANFEAEIKKALKADYTRGGLAVNHYFDKKENTPVIINGAVIGRAMFYDVLYYTILNDPFNQ